MRLVIIGAGGHGQVVADVALQLNKYSMIVFLDDNSEEAVGTCMEYADYINSDTEFYVAFGNNQLRLDWVNRLLDGGARLATIIHPSAYVSPKAKIMPGTIIMPMATVNTGTVVEMACIINISSIIDHGCIIEEGCHICVGAIIKGENRIHLLTKIEAGQVVEAREWPK